MSNPNKLHHAIGISFAASVSVLFGLMLISFLLGLFIVFESDIGGDINYELPITHLDFFHALDLYQFPTDISVGDVFIVLWVLYLVVFTIALLGPKSDFLKALLPIISYGKSESRLNYLVEAIKWFSILVLASFVINFIQNWFGIEIVSPPFDNDLLMYLSISFAPLIEEFIFRIILVGIPLFVLYSYRSSFRYFLRCLWTPSALDILDSKKAILLIVFVGVAFGVAHIAFEGSWSPGKSTQAAVAGIILGWVYLRYGFAVSLLIHWAANYFIISYVSFVSQINSISFENAQEHSLLISISVLILACGVLSVCVMVVSRFASKKKSNLEV